MSVSWIAFSLSEISPFSFFFLRSFLSKKNLKKLKKNKKPGPASREGRANDGAKKSGAEIAGSLRGESASVAVDSRHAERLITAPSMRRTTKSRRSNNVSGVPSLRTG